jgi:hypothetical protein
LIVNSMIDSGRTVTIDGHPADPSPSYPEPVAVSQTTPPARHWPGRTEP